MFGGRKKTTTQRTQELRVSTSNARNQSLRAREVSDNIVFILKQSLTPFWILIINAYFFFISQFIMHIWVCSNAAKSSANIKRTNKIHKSHTNRKTFARPFVSQHPPSPSPITPPSLHPESPKCSLLLPTIYTFLVLHILFFPNPLVLPPTVDIEYIQFHALL